jgi:uncharacterized RDD family membrane protein YckC
MFTILGADGKEYGPVSAGRVHEWLHGGRANLQTPARRADETEWKTLGDFPEFAGAAPSPLIESSLPRPVHSAPATAGILAGRGRRLAGAFIDGFLVWLCKLPIFFAVLPVLREAMADPEAVKPEMLTGAMMGALSGTLPFLGLLAMVQIALLCVRSQSLGKLLLGMRIVSVQTGEPGGPVRAFVLRSLVVWFVEQIPLLGLVFWLVDVCFIFRDDHRCLHDLLAGTRVVKVPRAD